MHHNPLFFQHNRFVLDCKDKEPDVLFVGDSMVQLLQQYEVLCGGGDGAEGRVECDHLLP